MQRLHFKRLRWGLALTLLLATVAAGSATGLVTGVERAAAQMPMPTNDGIVCTEDANDTFTLTTQTGYIGLPDDNIVFMWGFSAGGNGFQHPSPVLCVNEGDTVTVILHNTLPEAVSIVFPGQENVQADGAPSQPEFDGGGNLTSLTRTAAANGGSVTYSFVAARPGTFLYESGTNPARQVRMGLFGALVVRPALGAHYAFNRADSNFKAGNEYMVLLSEIDPLLNQAVERGQGYNLNNYRPRYWLINGRGFPDSIAPNFASWLPTQPYGALARINPYDPGTNPEPALVRYLNVGTVEYPFHPHGNHGRIIGRDGHPLAGDGGEDLSFEKFTVNIGPGQTWDATFYWKDAEGYNAADKPVDVTVPNLQNLFYGMFYSGSPYLGTQGELPVGSTPMTQCGEYYIIAHNHALWQLSSWGTLMTGPATFVRIDPPAPNQCQ